MPRADKPKEAQGLRMLGATLACCMVLLSGAGNLTAARSPDSTPAPSGVQYSNQSIRVTDFRNMPLADVEVKLQPRPPAPLAELVQETTVAVTNGKGEFQPPANPPKDSLLVLEKSGYGIMAYNAEKVPPRIILPPAGPLIGSLIDDRGVSVSNALIGPIEPPAKCEHGPQDSPHPSVSPLMFTRTDASGNFRASNLPIHKYSFLVRAPGVQPTLIIGRTGPPMQFMVNRGGTTVTGVLIGTKDGQSQPGVYIEAVDAQTRLYDVTDEQGQFEFPNLSSREWMFKPYFGPNTGNQSARALAVGGPDGGSSLTLLLNQGARIAGQVIDDLSSQPLAGIPVGIAAGALRDSVLTDSTGNFEFNNVDALEHYTIKFDAMKFIRVLPDGQTRDYYDLPPNADGQDRTDIFIALQKRALLQGRVVDASGSPVVDVTVEARMLEGKSVRSGKPGQERRQRAEYSMRSTTSGEFKLGVYPEGRYELTATTDDDRAAEPRQVDAYSTAAAISLEMRLRSTVSLGGMVVDGNDVPVSAAVVLAVPPGHTIARAPTAYEMAKFPNVKSNAHGEFEFKKLAVNQQVQLVASHPEFVGNAEGLFTAGTAATATTGSVKVRFASGQDFIAQVLDTNNMPVAEAAVALHYLDGLDGRQVTRTTDASGRVVARSVPAKKLERVTVRANGYAEQSVSIPLVLPQHDLVIRLKRNSSIVVKVVGTSAAQPSNDKPFAAVMLGVADVADAGAQSTAEPAAGSFSELFRKDFADGQARFEDLVPGWYKAALSGGGAYVESKAIYLAGDSQESELTIQPPPSATIRGKVADKNSRQPLAGATISIQPSAQVNLMQSESARTAYSDASGSFEIQNAPIGTVHFKVIAFGYPEYEQALQVSPSAPVELLLSNQPGGLAGTISLAGQPVKQALLVLASQRASESPVATAVTDDGGRYTMSGFTAGKYQLTIEAPAGAGDTTTRRSVEVEIADTNTRKDVDLPALVKVSGTVRLNGKAPARPDGSAPSLLFSPKSGGAEGRTLELSASGSFSAEIEPGIYNVGLDDQPGQEFEVKPGSAQGFNLSF